MHKVNLDWKVICVYADANTTDAAERHREIVYIRNYEEKITQHNSQLLQ